MRKATSRWIFLVILAFIIQVSANSSDYKMLFEDNHYLLESILQVLETDLDNNQNDEFVLAGKNDMNREVFLYWLTLDPENKPIVQWQSENLYEEHSIVWAVTGKFTTDKNQLLALSNSQYYLYQFENNHVNLLKKEKHSFNSLQIPSKDFDGRIINVASGDLDGDGQTEIVVARVGKITAKIYNGLIQVWKFNNNQAARELLLLQSSDWAFIMKTGTMVEYAVKRTKTHINRFNNLYEQIKYNHIDPNYLSQLEERDNIFPDMDYRIFNPVQSSERIKEAVLA